MMPLIHPSLWKPVDVESVEDVADEVIRECRQNRLVVAGPGAGKTELLAQRACYLLQTGICPAPYRILAVSFKRDAAKNLKERVGKRSGDLASRFDSFTLDAFAKDLVDRFGAGIPEEWRPKVGYEVRTGKLKPDDIRRWVTNAGAPPGHDPGNAWDLSDKDVEWLFARFSHGSALPYSGEGVHAVDAFRGKRWWREQLGRPAGEPSLTFPMLNRLAAFLLRHNPRIAAVLRSTYAFVFLDEFQDTTEAQYDLIRSAFHGSTSVMTAVGDSKQRIMVWAGAMRDAFARYEGDFSAQRRDLVRNYRSDPELVRMLDVIAQAVERGTAPATAMRSDLGGTSVLVEFSHSDDEAASLARLIGNGVRQRGMSPRNFCVLTRKWTSDMVGPLKSALAALSPSIRLRDESYLQDLLAEPVVAFLLAVLRLGTRTRDAEAWAALTGEAAMILGLHGEADGASVERECARLVNLVRSAVAAGRSVAGLPSELVAMTGEDVFRGAYRQYTNGSFLRTTVKGLEQALSLSATACRTACETVDDLIGKDIVPAMTVHKSKSLEFDTVIFVGLDDSQWSGFRDEPDEERRAFFVAFSRAVRHVVFTFSDMREGRWGPKPQRRAQIGDLYTILKRAGVKTLDRRRNV